MGRQLELHLLPTPQVSLDEVWNSVLSSDSESGPERLRATLDAKAYPHFEAVPGNVGSFRKIEQNGESSAGRFRDRSFIPEEPQIFIE